MRVLYAQFVACVDDEGPCCGASFLALCLSHVRCDFFRNSGASEKVGAKV